MHTHTEQHSVQRGLNSLDIDQTHLNPGGKEGSTAEEAEEVGNRGWQVGWECVGCLKACWEKREQRNGWRKQASSAEAGGENITRTELGCKCLRTCPLGWSEWQQTIDGGERSENAVCTHCLRGFNTPVCGQGVKTRYIPLFPNIHKNRHTRTQHTCTSKTSEKTFSTTI